MRTVQAASRYAAIKRRAKAQGYRACIILVNRDLADGESAVLSFHGEFGVTLGDDLASTEAILDKFEANPVNRLRSRLGLPLLGEDAP